MKIKIVNLKYDFSFYYNSFVNKTNSISFY